MSAVISGNADNVTTPLTATIIGMADNGSGLVRVQTSAPHLFADDDYVHIVTVTTVIDAYFSITVIDATHFDLQGSTYTGTGTGTATDSSLTPQIQVPTDGDAASLQLSGMLSALQALADRTQALRKDQVQRTTTSALVTSNALVVIPPWATHALLFGSGGGGGGGGGMGGLNGTSAFQFASGGGGAGAPLGICFGVIAGGATSFDVVIGAGGLGGAGSAGGASPSDAAAGLKGDLTQILYHDGLDAGLPFATFQGGAGGGGGSNDHIALTSSTPVYTPGGKGPGGFFRNGGNSKKAHYSPGPAQIFDLINTAGTITAGAAWPTYLYTDPVGQRDFSEGGASMATAGNATYAAGVSYDGVPSLSGYPGGSAGTEGAAGGAYPGGAAGGGGGGGGMGGPGGDGGNGGAGSTGGGATNGVFPGNAPANSGAGGGGGGGGGNGASSAGNGSSGGSGGSGSVFLLFIAAPVTP